VVLLAARWDLNLLLAGEEIAASRDFTDQAIASAATTTATASPHTPSAPSVAPHKRHQPPLLQATCNIPS
jgi:hypothetical protein